MVTRKVRAVIIYADVVLLLNFLMNSAILVLTAYGAGIAFSWNRIAGAAAMGGIYTLVGVFPAMSIFYSIPAKLIVSVLLVLAAFGYRSIKITIILTGIFFIVSFILGGAVLGWLYFIQTEILYAANQNINLSLSDVIIGSSLAIILIILVVKRLLGRMYRYKTLYQARIEYDGNSQEITGMMDTGNGLYSLMGRKPVVLVNLQVAASLLGAQVSDFLIKNRPDSWVSNLDTCQDSKWLARVEIIPCQSVGGYNMLLGFRPDSITVIGEKGAEYTAEALIGICDTVFDDNRECQALLHPALMTEVNITKGANTCVLPGR
ncbi:MAG: spoIIGA [Firmicutes bacterium]|nr:spoIIGA [Bacillota bacterium]